MVGTEPGGARIIVASSLATKDAAAQSLAIGHFDYILRSPDRVPPARQNLIAARRHCCSAYIGGGRWQRGWCPFWTAALGIDEADLIGEYGRVSRRSNAAGGKTARSNLSSQAANGCAALPSLDVKDRGGSAWKEINQQSPWLAAIKILQVLKGAGEAEVRPDPGSRPFRR
jgi:hypothetical protein